MQHLRAVITETLRASFPEMGESIREFHGLESIREGESPIKAPGLLVCAIDAVEGPVEHDPWPLELNYGLVLTVQGASAIERDKEGWTTILKVARVVWRNCWGYQRQIEVAPATIKGIRKNSHRNPDGTLSGAAYWTLEFSNLVLVEVALGLV